MKRWYAGIVIAVFLGLASTVLAYGPGGVFGAGGCGGTGPCVGGLKGGHGGPMGVDANLNLSKEQTDEMWQVTEKFRADTQKLRYELFQKRFEMKTLFADPNATDAMVLAKQRELSSLRQSMSEMMVQFRLAQRKILTPEQLKKLSEDRFERGFSGVGYSPGRRGSWGRGSGYRADGGCDW